MEDELKCNVCLDFATDAVETDCCHQVQCLKCISRLDICPVCRADLSYEPSIIIRRIIGKFPASCPNEGCDVTTTRGNLPEHLLKCKYQTFVCPARDCEFKSSKEAFASHIATVHVNQLMLNHQAIFENQIESRTDRIVTIQTSRGVEARLGETGKYFCGESLQFECGCCNGQCGPTNGCNCTECMKADVRARKLPRYWLVNRAGYACRRGQSGRFYCGRRVMTDNYNTDGYCGPTSGDNCYECRRIDEQKDTRYGNVWI